MCNVSPPFPLGPLDIITSLERREFGAVGNVGAIASRLVAPRFFDPKLLAKLLRTPALVRQYHSTCFFLLIG